MSPLPGSPENGQSSANAAAAALARANQAPKQKPTTQLVAEHDRRQAFRRLIDPGILRPNSKEQASSSLKVNPSDFNGYLSWTLIITPFVGLSSRPC